MSKASDYIRDYTKRCSNELVSVESKAGKEVIPYHEWLTPENALAAVEIERQEVIEKACNWLEPIFKNYAGYYCGMDMLEDFKQAMEKGE